MSRDSLDYDNSAQLRTRLWGAAVIIAIAVIVLPLILDGAGSESQFRRVENLREEPPAIVDSAGNRLVQRVPELRSIGDMSPAAALPDNVAGGAVDEPGQNDAVRAERQVRRSLNSPTRPELTAWVVQADVFEDERDALSLRDRLRQADFASFVRDRDTSTDAFQVLVGPIIKKETAENARAKIANLLQNEPEIMVYP